MKPTQEQLSAAFDLVKNKRNWKNPIKATIDNPGVEQTECIAEAIIHFTGSIPNIRSLGNGKIHVYAAGYYAMEASMEMFF